jgi:iron complex outermembrane recepter protein
VFFWNLAGAQIQPPDDKALALPKFEVSEHMDDESFDDTGMGSVEEDMRSEPFSNELTAVDFEMEESLGGDTSAELTAISTPSPAAAAAGEQRLNLRGFPTPVLRNSFIQMGILETLNIDKTIVIQGPLVPVLGRAAPGGIQNFLTTRPSARARNKLEASASTDNRERVSAETTGVLRPKKLWQRWAAEWQHRHGPEQFVDEDDLAISGSMTLKHSRAASSMLSVDYRRYTGHPSSGIPEYKTSTGEKVIGPYMPLADFNASGPDGGVVRETFIVGAQFEGQLSRAVALRIAAEGWTRAIDQQRFTASQYVLDAGLFEGTREPRHIAQRQQAVAAHIELTGRFRMAGIEHKLLTFAGVTWGNYERDDRALTTADRNALPESVRHFNPFDPDYFAPAFDPALYSRVLTDRIESARYSSLEVSDRMAFAQGRTVISTGLRYDEVGLLVHDERPGALFPRTQDHTAQLSYHAGANYQLLRNRVLLFTTASTAFDPTTPVDNRTGRIQENETTLGYEAGVKGRALTKRLDYTSSVFLLFNRNISRRNPLYDDPVLDANQTQPQLVAAGEERFSGLRAEMRYKFSETISLSARAVRMDAITTKSPALGREVGQQVSRLPRDTLTLQLRYSPAKGAAGLNAGAGITYIGDYVANYEDAKHAFLEYPGYTLLNFQVGYSWKIKQRQLNVSLSLRNAFNRDLLASNARVGADRQLGISTRMMF